MQYPLTDEEEKSIQPLVTKFRAIGAAAAEAWVDYREVQAKIKKAKKEGEHLFIAGFVSAGIAWLFDSDGFKYFAVICFIAGGLLPYIQCRDLERKLERIDDKIGQLALDWSVQFGGDKAIRVDLPRFVVTGDDKTGYFFDRDTPEFNRWLIHHMQYLYWSQLGHEKGDALHDWDKQRHERKYDEPFSPYSF